MEPSQVIHQLRTRCLYPVVAGDSIRLFGDMRQLTDGLRDAIKANRAGIIAILRAPGQSIAYDLLDIASYTDWHPTVSGDAITWTRGLATSQNPMPSQSLRDALTQHAADVIAVLRAVPVGCTNRARCERTGICADEIRESTCDNQTTTRPQQPP